ncbi:MAG: T9SS type A sorting domain-containing protein [Ignavibacterium sp.]|nr:MAG: T9SS type A sorting domain-containing protein [Ignavibacterium sp.]
MKNITIPHLFYFLSLLIISSSFAQYPNIRIDGPLSDAPEEVSITINPVDPNILAAGANLNHFYSSTDGGMSWSEKIMSSTFNVWGDPCVLFDNVGNLYYAHLSNPANGYFIDRIVIQKSTDNGMIWNDGAGVGFEFPKQQDKEWLAVDFTQSPYKGNVYVTWTEFDRYGSSNPDDSSRIKFSKSTDQGENWSDAITISDVSGNCLDGGNTTEGAVPCVGPNGEVYVSWAGPAGLVFDKSTDGGETWGTDIFVSDIPGGWAFNVPGIYRCNGLPITMCDIGESQFNGNIYICWGDQRNGPTDTDVFFSRSTDGGESWTPALRVNSDFTARHQFFPWMTVDQSTGNIWGIFYDRRKTTGVATDVYVVRSTDGGYTFENFKISESSFVPNSSVFFGDYNNIAAFNGKIYPIWTRLHGGQLSIWNTIITDTTTVSVDDEMLLPISYSLFQNYPNPFNPATTISYQLPEPAFVTVEVFDVLGNKIASLVQENKTVGVHEVSFDGSNLSSGIYLYQIDAEGFHQSRKMMLTK